MIPVIPNCSGDYFPKQGLYHIQSQYNCSSQEININTILSICRPQSHFVNHPRNSKTPNLSQYSVSPYFSGTQQFFNNTKLSFCRQIRNLDLSDMPSWSTLLGQETTNRTHCSSSVSQGEVPHTMSTHLWCKPWSPGCPVHQSHCSALCNLLVVCERNILRLSISSSSSDLIKPTSLS